MSLRKIEACVTTLHEAKEAYAGGACRVELCSALSEDGITPSYGLIRVVLDECPEMDVNVLIRPRGGDFVYTPYEIQTMILDIEACKELGVKGVVLGALTSGGAIDCDAMRRLIAVAKPMLSVTFHRAFDVCSNPLEAFERIISLGCDRLLTSGQGVTAELGLKLIASLVERSAGRIVVMPGCGVRVSNIAKIAEISGAKEFHSTARNSLPDKPYTDRNIVSQLVGDK